MEKFEMSERNTSKFHVDGIPPLKEAFPLGLQHVFAMVVANMVPAILIANVAGLSQEHSTMLIQASIIAAAVGTLIQLYPIPLFGGFKIGSRLPVMMGMGYVFLGASISVAAEHGLATLFGAQLVSAVICIFLGILSRRFRDIFTPLVSGIIVSCMGIGLFPVAINNLFGGDGAENFGSPVNLLIGAIVALTIIILQKNGKKLFKDLAILIGIAVGYVISLAFGMIDFSPVVEGAILAVPQPLAFGLEFNLEVIVVFTILFGVAIADIMGGFVVVTNGAMDREVTDEELSNGVIGAGVASIFSALINAPAVNIYGQNSAIVAMNKVTSRFVIAVATGILLVAGISPKVGALMTTIPPAVIGGATLVVFSSIAISGFRLLSVSGFGDETRIIGGVAIAFSIGLNSVSGALDQFPSIVQTLLGSSTVVSGALVAFILTVVLKVFNRGEEEAS